MSTAATATAGGGPAATAPKPAKKVTYNNDLMLKLRHMMAQPPALSTIPEGARAIFVLPNVAGHTTVHSVAVQKKAKPAAAASAAAAAAAGGATTVPIIGSSGPATATTFASAAAASAAASAFTVTSSPTAPPTAVAAGYAAALRAMSDAEREKLQEVRSAFMVRASESKQQQQAAAAAAAAAAATAAQQQQQTAATAAAATSSVAEKKKGWNTANVNAAQKGIDIAAAVAESKKAAAAAKKAAAATTTTMTTTTTTGGDADEAPKKQWSKVSGAASAAAVGINIAEIVPAQPISRNERKRLQQEGGGTGTGKGAGRALSAATTAAGKQHHPPTNAASPRAASTAAPRQHVTAPERYPAFMVATAVPAFGTAGPLLPTNTNATSAVPSHQSFFIGADGRKYPMPPNPFASLQQQQNIPAAALNAAGGVADTMDAAEWYSWWVQQAAFFPEYYPVPVQVPIDAMGNVLPFSALEKQKNSTNNKSAKSKSAANAAGNAIGAGDAAKLSKKRGAANASSSATDAATAEGSNNNGAATEEEEDGTAAAPATTTTGGQQFSKGRTAPATLSGEPLEARHRQRERQILLGKRTMGYFIYERIRAATTKGATNATSNAVGNGGLAAVSGAAITAADIPTDCHAPPFAQPCSKRSWDGQVRRWRNALHKLDKYADLVLTAEELQRFTAAAHRNNATNSARELNMDDDDDEEEDGEDAAAEVEGVAETA